MDAVVRVSVAEDDADDALVRAALLDVERFGAIYDRYKVPVFRYLRAHGASQDDALDLMALTFERAFTALPRYRRRDGGLRAWLFVIARNARIDEFRRAGAVSSLTLVGELVSDPTTARDPDLQVALARLPDVAREAVTLRYAGGLTAREIGAVLGKRPDAVQKLIERTLDTLREALHDR